MASESSSSSASSVSKSKVGGITERLNRFLELLRSFHKAYIGSSSVLFAIDAVSQERVPITNQSQLLEFLSTVIEKGTKLQDPDNFFGNWYEVVHCTLEALHFLFLGHQVSQSHYYPTGHSTLLNVFQQLEASPKFNLLHRSWFNRLVKSFIGLDHDTTELPSPELQANTMNGAWHGFRVLFHSLEWSSICNMHLKCLELDSSLYKSFWGKYADQFAGDRRIVLIPLSKEHHDWPVITLVSEEDDAERAENELRNRFADLDRQKHKDWYLREDSQIYANFFCSLGRKFTGEAGFSKIQAQIEVLRNEVKSYYCTVLENPNSAPQHLLESLEKLCHPKGLINQIFYAFGQNDWPKTLHLLVARECLRLSIFCLSSLTPAAIKGWGLSELLNQLKEMSEGNERSWFSAPSAVAALERCLARNQSVDLSFQPTLGELKRRSPDWRTLSASKNYAYLSYVTKSLEAVCFDLSIFLAPCFTSTGSVVSRQELRVGYGFEFRPPADWGEIRRQHHVAVRWTKDDTSVNLTLIGVSDQVEMIIKDLEARKTAKRSAQSNTIIVLGAPDDISTGDLSPIFHPFKATRYSKHNNNLFIRFPDNSHAVAALKAQEPLSTAVGRRVTLQIAK